MRNTPTVRIWDLFARLHLNVLLKIIFQWGCTRGKPPEGKSRCSTPLLFHASSVEMDGLGAGSRLPMLSDVSQKLQCRRRRSKARPETWKDENLSDYSYVRFKHIAQMNVSEWRKREREIPRYLNCQVVPSDRDNLLYSL